MSIVKSAQWYEFATNPAAVTFRDDEVVVGDWLIQSVAADTVAEVLVRAATEPGDPARYTIAGPAPLRLPELTRRLPKVRGTPGGAGGAAAVARPCRGGAARTPGRQHCWARTSRPGSRRRADVRSCEFVR